MTGVLNIETHVADWSDNDISARLWCNVVDRPTQLIYIKISICWVGGGNPCGAADFCISGPHGQEKQAGSDFFSKYPNYVYTNGQNAKYRAKIRQKTFKNPFFSSSSKHLTEFGLTRCATNQASPETLRNKSGQTESDIRRGWKKQGFWTFFCLSFALYFAFCPFVYT